jgi:threonine dehydrogenase-like Zn-dependent dehydrogenase
MTTMRAVVRSEAGVTVTRVPVPTPRPAEVRVRVRAAGVCRTDLRVASGALACDLPRILGHEFAGEVDSTGSMTSGWSRGAAVTAMPVLPDGRMLGVDRDGAFAEYVCVPADCVFPLAAGTPWTLGAYAEPVAAALAVTEIGLAPDDRVLILGGGRIAELARRALEASGQRRVDVMPAGDGDGDEWDVIVESHARPDALEQMLARVRRGGTLVLKSRADVQLSLPLARALAKEVTIRAVRYGSFSRAVQLIGSGALSLDGLVGPVRDLASWREAFDAGEAQKSFLTAL